MYCICLRCRADSRLLAYVCLVICLRVCLRVCLADDSQLRRSAFAVPGHRTGEHGQRWHEDRRSRYHVKTLNASRR